MKKKYDFAGWATRNNMRCADGRTIMPDAFSSDDGQTVPLCWSHQHNEPWNVLGHALLENRREGVYAYCEFNDTESGQNAKELVNHGDIASLSIYANQVKQNGAQVIHGAIREVSLVLAGANPGAKIDLVMSHGIDEDDEARIWTGEDIELYHEDTEDATDICHSEDGSDDDETLDVRAIINDMTDEQKKAVYALVGAALSEEDSDDEEGEDDMKHNIFDADTNTENTAVITHDEQHAILELAQRTGSFKKALNEYYSEDGEGAGTFAHGFDDVTQLFPDPHDIMGKGAPEAIPENNTWVDTVMRKINKTPFNRIRTRQADVSALRAKGYKTKGEKKTNMGNISLVTRTTDPTTVYVKDEMNRDDVLDITDFNYVEYQWQQMDKAMREELATAFLVGDGRDDGDPDKIDPTKIRPIWTDPELYAMHVDIDLKKAKATMQGSNTALQFGDNYVFAEAVIETSLYAREKYKGGGKPDFYCSTHTVNRMLMARDLNGRRIYTTRAELESALNVNSIIEVDKFDGLVRDTDHGSKHHNLLGIFVNLDDYKVCCSRGGEVTKFSDFDIDYNKEKYLMETRLGGALIRVGSAIVLEEPSEGGLPASDEAAV